MPTAVIASATPTTSSSHDRFVRQSLPVAARTASSRARPTAVKAAPRKTTVPMKAADVKATSAAPLVIWCPRNHGRARPGTTQRSS